MSNSNRAAKNTCSNKNRVNSKLYRERKKAKIHALKDRIVELDALILDKKIKLNIINREIFILSTTRLSSSNYHAASCNI